MCVSTIGQCTLRAAIEEANAQTKGSTITLNLPAGIYGLMLGVLAVSGNTISIDSTGASQTVVTAEGKSQVFSVAGPAHVTLQQLTLIGGNGGYASGGGLVNRGTTSVNRSAIVKNTAGQGGGI